MNRLFAMTELFTDSKRHDKTDLIVKNENIFRRQVSIWKKSQKKKE
jgi:hypothetical protein